MFVASHFMMAFIPVIQANLHLEKLHCGNKCCMDNLTLIVKEKVVPPLVVDKDE